MCVYVCMCAYVACVVCGVWCVVCGVWCVVCALWCVHMWCVYVCTCACVMCGDSLSILSPIWSVPGSNPAVALTDVSTITMDTGLSFLKDSDCKLLFLFLEVSILNREVWGRVRKTGGLG